MRAEQSDEYRKSKIPSVFRLSVSAVKGKKRQNVGRVTVTLEGIEGDAHADTIRALSLLPYESYEMLMYNGLNVNPGDFGENITTLCMDFEELSVGTKMALGDTVVIEVVQVGKDCHNDCVMKRTVGDCLVPCGALFARVITGGELNEGDSIRIIK